MPSGHKKEAIKEIRNRYGIDWSVEIISDGVKLCQDIAPVLERYIHFTFVRDDVLGLRIQPGLGITYPAVNVARDAISPRHQYTVDSMTGFIFLNNMIDPALRQNGGWLFESGAPLQPGLDSFLALVDETIQRSGFFESLLTIDDYVTAIETNRWKFITGVLPYLYALIAQGEIVKAKKIAGEYRDQIIKSAVERGLIQRASDTYPYEEILAIPD
jgi:hypothetical protein